jgi:hypothetical protein
MGSIRRTVARGLPRRGLHRRGLPRRGELLALAALTAVLIASVVWRPADDGGLILCAFRRLTGLPCMGCGLTRSFCAIAKGEVARAAAFHPLGPAVFAATVVYWARGLAAVAGFSQSVTRFDRVVERLYLPLVAVVTLIVGWVAQLILLGLDGRLAGLAHGGLLFRLLAGYL